MTEAIQMKPIERLDHSALPSLSQYNEQPDGFDPTTQTSIETGFFVFTMMPSLRCDLNCPHCYLTLDQRRNSPIMSLDDLELACRKVDDYYQSKQIDQKMIVCYWYGGEPTQMGQDYMLEAFQRIDRVFSPDKGYYVRHDVLTSLLTIDPAWYDIFETWGRGHFQTSFDGLMRGKGYMKKWDKKVREAVSRGLSVSTISVINNELVDDGPEAVMDYLVELGIREASFLPFMLNENNQKGEYEQYAPPMHTYSDFMIALTKRWEYHVEKGNNPPSIGQAHYILSRQISRHSANIAGQTLFLLPEGEFVLPDYKDGYLEYQKSFGNILKQDFHSILTSRERRDYLRRQYTRNHNPECVECEFMDQCIMEFWKENRDGDDCFGAKRYVQWLNDRARDHPQLYPNNNNIMF